MHTHTAKQDALAVIQRLPENVEMEEIMYRLFIYQIQPTHIDILAIIHKRRDPFSR